MLIARAGDDKHIEMGKLTLRLLWLAKKRTSNLNVHEKYKCENTCQSRASYTPIKLMINKVKGTFDLYFGFKCLKKSE